MKHNKQTHCKKLRNANLHTYIKMIENIWKDIDRKHTHERNNSINKQRLKEIVNEIKKQQTENTKESKNKRKETTTALPKTERTTDIHNQ